MMLESRVAVQNLNPFVGPTPADTLENLCLCLDKLGVSIASRHDDDSITFFCRGVSAALRYEATALREQGRGEVKTVPVRRVTSS